MQEVYRSWTSAWTVSRHEQFFHHPDDAEAATRGVLKEKVFITISQNLQENTCARVFFLIKLQAYCKVSLKT